MECERKSGSLELGLVCLIWVGRWIGFKLGRWMFILVLIK